MPGLDRRLSALEQRAALPGAADGPYSPAWKSANLPADDNAGFDQLWGEFWAELSPEFQAGIQAGFGLQEVAP